MIQIQLDPQTVLAVIPEDFIGFGYETSAVAQPGFFSAKNAHMVQLYRTLGPHGLIRIGGNISDHTRFEANGTTAVRNEKDTTVINQNSLEDLGSFLRATGWKAMWGLNLGTGSKEEAVEEARAVQAAVGDRLHSFEIGNEVDLLPRFKSYESYHTAYLEYKAAIRNVLPDAVFSGPDVASKTQWALDFAATESADMKLLTHHYYRSGAMRPDATIETLLTPSPRWSATLQKLQEACAGKGIRYRINEVNSFYGGGKEDVSDTFASALWSLDYMFELASHGCAGINLQTDINQHAWVSHYSPIFKDADGHLSARPEYYGMLAFALAGKGSLVKLALSQNPASLTAYATKSTEGALWVILINKDLSQPAALEIAVPDGFEKAAGYELAAPSVTSKSDVILAGASASADGRWSPSRTAPYSIAKRIVKVLLPAARSTLLELR